MSTNDICDEPTMTIITTINKSGACDDNSIWHMMQMKDVLR